MPNALSIIRALVGTVPAEWEWLEYIAAYSLALYTVKAIYEIFDWIKFKAKGG